MASPFGGNGGPNIWEPSNVRSQISEPDRAAMISINLEFEVVTLGI